MWDILNSIGTTWRSLDSTLQAGVANSLSTIMVGIAGFAGVILTIKSQGRQTRLAAAEAERHRLRAAIYEDALQITRSLADSAISLQNRLRFLGMQVVSASQAHQQGGSFQLPAARYPDISASYESVSNAILGVIFLVENRRIIDPRLLIFRTAYSSVLFETRRLMFGAFVEYVMRNIPTDNPAGGIFPYTPPTVSNADYINGLCHSFVGHLQEAVAYSEDLNVELQNLLLGDLFENMIAPRQPLDPNARVITLDRAAELEQWFQQITAWGKDRSKVLAEVSAQFATQGN